MHMPWIICVVINFSICFSTHQAILWREREDYPKDHDHFQVYLARQAGPMTGERALTDGCGAKGRPYRYRGKRHIGHVRDALDGVSGKVWVGAVKTTTPWEWSNGQALYQLEGLTSSDKFERSNGRIPGNNVFLCSLQCNQVAFILVQGNRCACSETRPEMLPSSDTLFRCPGTHEDYCGTVRAYSVYRNLLAETIQWDSLDDKSSYHGHKAYLYRSHQDLSGQAKVTLKAEVDPQAEKGYICNSTVLTIRQKHTKHLWVEHSRNSALTWDNAMTACMNKGRQLMTAWRGDYESCIAEVEKELKGGKDYWVGLSRQILSLWLDGTPVKTSIHNHRLRGQPYCLTMSFVKRSPTFIFESCTDVQNYVLCEKDKEAHLHSYTHDTEGNHVITHSVQEENEFTGTVSILIGALAVLTVMSIALVILIYNRDKWIPKKSKSNCGTKHPSTTGPHSRPTSSSSSAKGHQNDDNVNISVITLPSQKYNEEPVCNNIAVEDSPEEYGFLRKGTPSRPQSDRISEQQNSRLSSGSQVYTEVDLPENSHYTATNTNQGRPTHVPSNADQRVRSVSKDTGDKAVNGSASLVRVLDYRADSSQSSVTGSDDAYSVLSYRNAIQKAWTGFKRTAYAHIMIHRPKKSLETAEEGDESIYDVASTRLPRVPCIDHDYDHAEPSRDVQIVKLPRPK